MSYSLTLVIPILNERELLEERESSLISLQKDCGPLGVQLLIVDGGSSDGSVEFLKEKGLFTVTKRIEKPSVARTILLSVDYCEAKWVWIVPLDCTFSRYHLKCVLGATKGGHYGAFTKLYDEKNILLTLQEKYLNLWRLKAKSLFVWTNCPFGPKQEIFEALKQNQEFLSDVSLSKKLLGLSLKMTVISQPITCSSRRYFKRGVILQIMTNFFVLLGSFLGFSPQKLKLLYK